MNVFQLSRQFKAQLLNREKTAALQMLRRYHDAYAGIQHQIAVLTDKMDAARLAGKEITPGWLFRERRLESLLAQTKAQMAQFGAYAGPAVKRQKYEAIIAAEREARLLARAALGTGAQVLESWSTLPVGALESLAGTFERGSPVEALFESFGEEAAASVRKSLIAGVATGQGPRAIARTVRDALGEPLTRALTISRTETIRSYREASIASYAANDDVVERWRWTATKTARTCAMCLAMDGQEFDFETPFGSHPCCRCVPVPVTKTWAELGISGVEERPALESGAAWFARQTEEVQQQVLGPGKFELFERGEMTLRDLVGYRDDAKWGPTRFEKSAKSITAGRMRSDAPPPPPPDKPNVWTPFDDDAEQDKFTAQSFDGWKDTLTAEEVEALELYQSSGARYYNQALRHGEDEDGEPLSTYQPQIDLLDSAIAKGRIDRDIVTYRGFASKDLASRMDTLEGSVFHDKAFLSTTLSRDVAEKFVRYNLDDPEDLSDGFIVEMHIPKGMHAANMMEVIHGEFIRAEREILLARDSKYRVSSARELPNGMKHLILEAL